MMMMMMKRHGYTCITGGTLHGDFTARLNFSRTLFAIGNFLTSDHLTLMIL